MTTPSPTKGPTSTGTTTTAPKSTFLVRFPGNADTVEKLRRTAEREGRSMNDVAVDAIERYASERTRLRDEFLAEIIREDQDILDALA